MCVEWVVSVLPKGRSLWALKFFRQGWLAGWRADERTVGEWHTHTHTHTSNTYGISLLVAYLDSTHFNKFKEVLRSYAEWCHRPPLICTVWGRPYSVWGKEITVDPKQLSSMDLSCPSCQQNNSFIFLSHTFQFSSFRIVKLWIFYGSFSRPKLYTMRYGVSQLLFLPCSNYRVSWVVTWIP